MKTNHSDKIPKGMDLLHDPFLNKGTAFTREERDRLSLRGLLPPRVCSPDKQVERVMGNFHNKTTDLEKYIFMISLQDRNETLFYRVVLSHLEEIMPIIYTPTVGQACQQYAHIYRRSRGLFISPEDRGGMKEVLRNWPHKDIRVIVVTDGERILGLGDLGANGMGIPVGKLSLYTACAGVNPMQCLPVTLDVGTDNESLLEDSLYLGMNHKRLREQEYDDFVEEFIQAVTEVFPNALVQFEDFANRNAFPLLERYRNRICTFNDDIQGTAAVALAGLVSALRITGGKLEDQTLLLFGAGEAAMGISDLFCSALVTKGVSPEDARKHCWMVDSKGLVVSERNNLTDLKRKWAHPHEPMTDPTEIIKSVGPTAILGVSGQPGTFTREVIEEISRINKRPIVFALSNPTSKSECSAEEAYTWSRGSAVFASGSPFDPVTLEDGRTFVPGQGNNAYIFPGVGLGVVACGATRVTDEMFFAAANTLAGLVTGADLEKGRVYPSLERIREVSAAIAKAVAEIAYESGLAREPRPENLAERIEQVMYCPDYPTLTGEEVRV